MSDSDTSRYVSAYRDAGINDAFAALGMNKEAFLGAMRAGFQAAKPLLQMGTAATKATAGTQGLRAAAGVAKNTGMAAGRTFGQTFAQQAPGVTKALQRTGKVLMHPATQTAMVAAPLVTG